MEELKPRCQTPKDIPTYDYAAAIEAVEAQHEIFWLPTEPKVEKDLHCIKTELTEAEYHGVITTLKLFTLYEQVAGNEYWGGRFKRMFPRPDFRRMAAAFANVELNVHAPFYQRVDEILGLNTDEFYSSFTDDPILKARMDFLDTAVSDKEDLYSVGTFSMVEGSILYSNFAFLMHFQAEGKNKITNTHSGLTFSAKDENLHSEGGAWAFRTLLSELREMGRYLEGSEEWELLKKRLYKAAKAIYEHECQIIDMVFSKGAIVGITATQLKHFVESRIDLCLENLGLDKVYKPTYNPVAKWFYNMIGSDVQHDFFAKLGSSYNRNWSETGFVWKVGGINE
jgi:ribonucleoside-diphosphate reductase beta chain